MKFLFSTAYWPPVIYWQLLLSGDDNLIEKHENFQKQSYRNRCHILSANGVLPLVIPVARLNTKEKTGGLKISYSERWQARHWRAITSAYNNSPFFEYFEDDIRVFYEQRYGLLFDYNESLMRVMLKMLRIRADWKKTEEYFDEIPGYTDLRGEIHPKRKPGIVLPELCVTKPYYQTFSDRYGFVENLSVLDLVFNTGLKSLEHLRPGIQRRIV